LRADTNQEVTLGELLERDERNIPVWSVEDDFRLVRRTMTHVFPSGTKPVYRLRLASGREVKASGNHPFLALDGWRSVDELRQGMRIGVPRRLAPPSAVEERSADEVILLAHLIGDGCFVRHQPLHYTSADPANLEAVEQAAKYFGVTGRRVRQANWWHTYLPAPQPLARGRRNPIAAWLDESGLYGARSYEKFVPPVVFSLPDEQIKLFLRHLWATDGSITLGRAVPVRIYYATTSERLALDVQSLLLRLDVRARVRQAPQRGHRPGYSVDIYGVGDQLRFLREVGVHGSRGVQAALAEERLRGVRSNPNADTIPLEVWRQVRIEMNGRGLTERAFQAAVGSAYCGSTFYRHSPSRPRLEHLASILDSRALHEFATSDLFWDTVASIEPLGDQQVYDATVPGTHNFIANGIVAHNSIEQDADVVLFLYRAEDQNPEAEVELVKAKVAKHRNGPIGEVPLQFRKANTRFYSVDAREQVSAY
jgi:replicative DNA helicase